DLLLDVLDLLAVGLLSLVVFGVAGHLGSLPQSGLCVDHRLAHSPCSWILCLAPQRGGPFAFAALVFATSRMKSATCSRSLPLWMVLANCADNLVISGLNALIASSKSRKAKFVGGGFGAGGGTAGGGPSRISLISGSSSGSAPPSSLLSPWSSASS